MARTGSSAGAGPALGPLRGGRPLGGAQVLVSAEAVPFRPSVGSTSWWVPPFDGVALVEQARRGRGYGSSVRDGRDITVAFVDGDLWEVAGDLGSVTARSGTRSSGLGPWSRSMPPVGTGSLR